ncbi:MAG: OB-fold domain-containing protein [Armatimonadetes bacterium]|nr:OB-fold domain-containing protein [Armatimonadota bacterium]
MHTYAVLHLDRDGRPLEAPEVVAYVQIDGTDGGLVTRLLDVDHDRVAIGLPVEAVLLPARERRGAITDIQGFRPRRGGTP